MIHNRFYHFILSILGFGAIAVAFLFETYGNVSPCALCIYERLPYMLIGGFSFWLFVSNLKASLFCNWMIFFAFLMLLGLSIYHVGIEQSWFQERCAITANSIPCAVAAFKFLGFSLATWNFVIGLMGSLLHGYFLNEGKDY